jgi:hypothetical protein
MTLSGLVRNYSGALAARFFLGGEYGPLLLRIKLIQQSPKLDSSRLPWRSVVIGTTPSICKYGSPSSTPWVNSRALSAVSSPMLSTTWTAQVASPPGDGEYSRRQGLILGCSSLKACALWSSPAPCTSYFPTELMTASGSSPRRRPLSGSASPLVPLPTRLLANLSGTTSPSVSRVCQVCWV